MRGDYSNGRIYFIEPICEHEDNEFYYGSTLQKLCKRMDKHRRDFKSWKDDNKRKIMCFELFEKYGIENCKIYLAELYPCKSREELEAREGYYIRNYDCVNKNIPGRTKKEYYNDNKDEILVSCKKYYKDKKDEILEYRKKYYKSNKDEILEYHKKYRNDNKDKLNKYQKEKGCIKIECSCGGRYTNNNKSIHIKTKKHIKYEEEH
jgi:hypothetical protein